ncbi:MAG: hypothetical protein IJ516_02365, partial [Phascolarctobacterium sp.]|nr:hypothetical protein [Phascolarctobacterium sp.]
NKKLYALNTSLLSEADKLYALTTYEVDDKVFTPKDDDKQEEVPAIIKRMQEKEETKIVNVTPAEIDVEVRDKIWQEHKRYVKKFKASKFKEAATKEDKK